jgi:parvulin-like peptidyl-prolyl isomerase
MTRFYLAIIVAALAWQTAPTARAQSLFGDKVVAKGKTFEIKSSEIEETYISYKANRVALNQPVPRSEEDIKKVEQDILDTLISARLLMQRATPEDRTNGLAQAAKFIEERMTNAPSEAAFKRQLRATGVTYEQFERQVQEQGIIKALVDRELRPKQAVMDSEIEKFYKDNPKMFEEPERWKVQHIFLGARDRTTKVEISDAQRVANAAKAKEIAARAKSEDFTKLVKEFSEHTASKDTDGESTFFKGQMPPQFEAAVLSMKPGQVSDVIVTALGWHIIKSIEYTPAKLVELNAVKDRINDALLQDATQKALPAFVAELRKEAGVEVAPEFGK